MPAPSLGPAPVPAPVVDPATLARADKARSIGVGLLIPGALTTVGGIAGTIIGIYGSARVDQPWCEGNLEELFSQVLTFGISDGCIEAASATEYADKIDRARLQRTLGYGIGLPAIAVGLTMMGVGAWQLSRAHALRNPKPVAQVFVLPQLGLSGGGLVVGGRF